MTMARDQEEKQGAKELFAARKAAKRLHVVVLPYQAKGHSIPLLHFAKRLFASTGIVVAYINTYSHPSPEHFRTLDGLHSSAMRVVPVGVPPPQGEGQEVLPYVHHIHELVLNVQSFVGKLFDAPEEDAPPTACIVSDMFLGWTQVVADDFKIPSYVLFTSPAGVLATMLHFPELIRQGRLPIDLPSRGEELVYDIPGVLPTVLVDLPSPMRLEATAFLFRFFVCNAELVQEAAGVLVNTFYELEYSSSDALRGTTYRKFHGKEEPGRLLSILSVGPLLPNAYFESAAVSANMEERELECLQWLDTQPDSSVLYVSFGSVAVRRWSKFKR